MTREDDSFGGDSSRVGGEEGTGSDEINGGVVRIGRNAEEDGGGVAEGDGEVGRSDRGVDSVTEESFEFMNVVGSFPSASSGVL